jgi:lysophospholipase L1-like esterase
VVNEGLSGAASIDGVNTIQALLQKHPQAQFFMVMYGHNDAQDGIPSGLGLNPGDIGYTGSFKERIQTIINAVRAAGKTPLLAKAPAILPFDGPWDSAVQQYNAVMAELAANPANGIPVAPPDFYTYFRNHPEEYAADILMNGVGYQSMAQIWRATLAP